jgi:hypothetical protein
LWEENVVATLDANERARTVAQYMRDNPFALGAVTKADIPAALAATDQWIEDNQNSFNAALPQPFRGAASLQAKTLLFCYVAMRRAGRLRAEEDG